MLDFCEINERLKDILAVNGMGRIKDADVAKALGITPNTYTGMKFRSSIPYPQIMNFLHSKGISINLFFYGKEVANNKKYKILRLFNVTASLGGGALNENIAYENVLFDTHLAQYFKINDCDIIKAVGDSMTPIIEDGDLCIIERNNGSVKNGEIYAINTLDGLFIKRLFIDGDNIKLVSTNEVYSPMNYRSNEIMIIGLLKGILRAI